MKHPEYLGIALVCEASEVETRSCQGYQLVDIVQSDRIESATETTTEHQNYQNHQALSVQRHFVVRSSQFVMVLAPDSAIAKLTEEKESLLARLHIADASARNAEHGEAEARKRADAAEKDSARLRESLRNANDDFGKCRARYRKMEDDLGKVRKAVGDIRMKEILDVP